jgi:cysteine desulfurase
MSYFDHNATTPIHPLVLNKMSSTSEACFGNPSSIHTSGRKAKSLIESSRRVIAKALQASTNEIIFTGSGTEANNSVLWSLIYEKNKHVITSSIEHPAILKVLDTLSLFGVSYTKLPVNKFGEVNPQNLEESITDNTGLISIMMINNEVGTINPIKDLIKVAEEKNIPFHSDAVQTIGKIPLSVKNIQADYLSFSGHKFYGPKGVGFLYKKKKSKLNPLIIGGGQEGQFRAGTENISGIVGLAEAVRLSIENLDNRILHLEKLEYEFKDKLLHHSPNVIFNGHPEKHAPGVISASFIGKRSDILLAELDREGIEVSSGSACGSGSVKPSFVLEEMGIPENQNTSTIRISFGRSNSIKDVSILVKALVKFTNV